MPALPRRLLTAIAFLIVGGAFSTLIAWSIELRSVYLKPAPAPVSTFTLIDPATPAEHIQGDIQRRFGLTVCSATRTGSGGPSPAAGLPTWFTLPAPGIGETSSAMAVGFPFPCLSCDFNYQSAAGASFRAVQYQHGVSITIPGRAAKIILATHPLVPGLLANSAIYATLLAATFWFLRHSRRHLRLRRGHCPFCGYDVEHNFTTPCPECGKLRAASTVAQRAQTPLRS